MLRKVRLGAFEVNVRATPRFGNFWDRVGSGRWEPTTIGLIQRAAKDKLYIDVGGWIGPTVMAGALVADKVIAYEPDPVAIEELRANLRANDFVNVEIREVALFDRNGTVSFGPGASDALGLSESSIVIGEATTSVRSVDVLDEVARPEFLTCGLIKIDVEGAEYQLIHRMARYLRAHRPTLLLSVHDVAWPACPRVAPLAGLCRKAKDVFLRDRLFWSLRAYRHRYRDARSRFADDRELWQPLSGIDVLRLVLSGGAAELLFIDDPRTEAALAPCGAATGA